MHSSSTFFKCMLAFTFFLMICCKAGWSQQPAGTALLKDGLQSFTYFGKGDVDSIVKLTSIADQAFQRALEINTYHQPINAGKIGLEATIPVPLQRRCMLDIL